MTSRKYAVYYLDPKTGTVNVTRGYYEITPGYIFALIPNNKKRETVAIDVWTGYPIFTTQLPIKDTIKAVLDCLDKLEKVYEWNERRREGDDMVRWNGLLRSSIPDEADLPDEVYQYIRYQKPFTEVNYGT